MFGLSLLVDSIDHPKPPASTEGTVLGPFHTHEAHEVPSGESISQDVNGEPLLVICTIKNTAGEPIQDVKVDIWETDSTGHYDVQHADYDGPDGRCVMLSDKDGLFWFKGIVPVPYPSKSILFFLNAVGAAFSSPPVSTYLATWHIDTFGMYYRRLTHGSSA